MGYTSVKTESGRYALACDKCGKVGDGTQASMHVQGPDGLAAAVLGRNFRTARHRPCAARASKS